MMDYKQYPKNWLTDIRPGILARAGNCCEVCGAEEYAIGYRSEAGEFIQLEARPAPEILEEYKLSYLVEQASKKHKRKLFVIILALRILDNNRANMQESNLLACCQYDHFKLQRKF